VRFDHLGTRPKPKVEGVPQNDIRTDFRNVARQHALDRAVGAYGHESRRLNTAAREIYLAPARQSALFEQAESQEVTCCLVRNMASP